MSSLHSIYRKNEWGAVMGKYGNACFFTSFLGRASDFGIDPETPYETLLELGGWPSSRRGTMVDTDTDSQFIENLARIVNVRIVLAYEEPGRPGLFAKDKVRWYGTRGPVIGIVKLDGRAHFNSFITDFTFLKEPGTGFPVGTAPKTQAQVKQECYIAADARLAQALQDREREALRQEDSDRKMAEELQRIFSSI